jgi:acyl carrier protein
VDDTYRLLTKILESELQTPISPLRPDTVLDDLPGWDSVTLAGVLLSIEEQFQVNAVRRDVVATTGAELFQICQTS